jgi:hypothetical protein
MDDINSKLYATCHGQLRGQYRLRAADGDRLTSLAAFGQKSPTAASSFFGGTPPVPGISFARGIDLCKMPDISGGNRTGISHGEQGEIKC